MFTKRMLAGTALILLAATLAFSAVVTPRDFRHTDHRQTPRLMFNPAAQPAPSFSAEETAINYLKANTALFALPADLSNLVLDRVDQSLLGWHIHFQQRIGDIPVEGGEIIISTLYRSQRVYQVFNNTYPQKSQVAVPKTVIGEERALNAAWNHLKVHGNLLGTPAARLEFVPEGADFRLVYKTLVATEAPFGYWEHVIDAESGQILVCRPTEIDGNQDLAGRLRDIDSYEGAVLSRPAAVAQYAQRKAAGAVVASPNAVTASGTAKVFDPDPKTTLNTNTLTNTSPASAFAGAYFTRTLQGITLDAGVYKLIGPWVQIQDLESPYTAPSTTTTGNWTAEREHDSLVNDFNDAMVYFHIDQNQRYVQSLGFNNVQHGSIEADSDGLGGDDNSHYVPGSNTLAFGHGGVPDPEDSDVILHEYWHALQNSINSNWGGADTGAMGEGFGDYWGASYGYVQTNGPVFHPSWAFHWDGHNSYWAGRNLDLVTLQYDPTKTYPAHSSVGGVSGDELWGTPVWQAFLTLFDTYGRPRDEMDKITIQSNFGMGSGVRMPEMASSMINASNLLYPGGPHAEVYLINFDRHNILEMPKPEIALNAMTVTAESCLPVNGAIDPNETVTCTFSLKNVGPVDAVDMVATLQASGGVASPSDPQSYGAMTAGGAAVSRDFSFTINPYKVCGDVVTLSFKCTDGTTTLETLKITLRLGKLFPAGSYTTGAIVEPIPDNDPSGVMVPIQVLGTGTIGNIRAKVRLNHARDGDIALTLIAPDGTSVMLADHRGGTGQDYGSGNTDCSGTYCTFDDEAADPISSSATPFTGVYRPDSPLAALMKKNMTGYWFLKVVDSSSSNTGAVYCVTLEFFKRACCGEIPCTTPDITAVIPPSVRVNTGHSAHLEVTYTGSDPMGIQWYEGDSGDTSHPVEGAVTAFFNTPAITADARYWVRVANNCGYDDSPSIPVTIWNTYYLPHVVSSDLWWSKLSMVNATGLVSKERPTGTATISAYNEAGTLLETVPVTISDRNQFAAQITNLFTPATLSQSIWLKVESVDELKGLVEFGTQDGLSQANLPYMEFAANKLVFPYVVSFLNWYTGLTLVNTSDQNAALTLKAYDETGALLAEKAETIGARGKYVRLIDSIFSGVSDVTLIRSIAVDSDRPLVGFELFGSLADAGLAGLPMIRNDQPEPTNYLCSLLFPEVPDNVAWYTGVTFSNQDSATAAITADVYSHAGQKLGSESFSLQPHQQLTRELQALFADPKYQTMSHFILGSDQRLSGFELVLSRALPFRFDGLEAMEQGDQKFVFPVTPADDTAGTILRFVNRNGSAITVNIMAYDAAGNLLGTFPCSLAENEKLDVNLETAFAAVHTNIAWMRAESTGLFNGHAFIVSKDNQRLIMYAGVSLY